MRHDPAAILPVRNTSLLLFLDETQEKELPLTLDAPPKRVEGRFWAMDCVWLYH
jgi:hypothetical protein